jgi:hypothetical protein
MLVFTSYVGELFKVELLNQGKGSPLPSHSLGKRKLFAFILETYGSSRALGRRCCRLVDCCLYLGVIPVHTRFWGDVAAIMAKYDGMM